jgi:hypothetical protein
MRPESATRRSFKISRVPKRTLNPSSSITGCTVRCGTVAEELHVHSCWIKDFGDYDEDFISVIAVRIAPTICEARGEEIARSQTKNMQ